MSEDLSQALAPVASYYRGKKLTVNTVLAAHMRSRGIAPTGPNWKTAKNAYQNGASFADAAAQAGGTTPDSIRLNRTNRSGGVRHSQSGRAKPGKSSTPPPLGTRQSVKSTEASSKPSSPRASDPEAKLDVMEWFPKRFSQGDMHGQGTENLLGRPNLANLEVLVRETAQNSWDARGSSSNITFSINLRRLTGLNLSALRRHVFHESGNKLGLNELLLRETVWVLEISDRGTTGLGGPTRNDLVPQPGEPTNFIDFVFDLGAPKAQAMSGGTFGYGKTVSYSTSRVGTVLIWSRCQSRSGIEDRLIGSAIGPSFNQGGRRYTGRHWWGKTTPDGTRVDPFVGENAARIARQIYESDFDGNQTGTSLLILDPDFGDDLTSHRDQVAQLADIAKKHLWPKLVPSEHVRARMEITIQLDGEDIPIAGPDEDRLLSSFANCLNAVRRIQADSSAGGDSIVHTVPIQRYKTTVGHLSLTRFPTDLHKPSPPEDDEALSTRLDGNRVALMRHEAELVVKYLEFPGLPLEGFDWVGVFKPVGDTDRAFALAEPPAHDEWHPATIANKTDKSIVNVALRRLRESVVAYLAPVKPSIEDIERPPAAQIGDFLSGLLVGLGGTAPTRIRRNTQTRAKHKARPRAEIINVDTVAIADSGWNKSNGIVVLHCEDREYHTVSMELSVGVEGNSRDSVDSNILRNFQWATREGVLETDTVELKNGERAAFTFESSSKVAIDLRPYTGEA